MNEKLGVIKTCADCGQPMQVRTNRESGPTSLGCTSWPECEYTEPIAAGYTDAAVRGAGIAGVWWAVIPPRNKDRDWVMAQRDFAQAFRGADQFFWGPVPVDSSWVSMSWFKGYERWDAGSHLFSLSMGVN